MTRFEFLDALQKELDDLPESDIKASIQYYNEMIDDKMEDGLTVEAAVADIGNPQKIAEGILSDTPLSKIVKNKMKQRRRLSAFEIVLLILGSPIWLSLIISAFAVALSVYATLWSVVISVFATFFAISVSGIATLLGSAVMFIFVTPAAAGLCFGASLILIGLAILLYFASALCLKAMVYLSKKIFLLIKSCFIKKEAE